MIAQQSFSVDRGKYGVMISWDRARKEVDLDLQVVVIDSAGLMIDAIYHNNLVALNGAVSHSGDAVAKEGGGVCREMVWVDITKLPMRVKLLIFVVASAEGGHLIDVRRGVVSIVKSREGHKNEEAVLAMYPMENSTGDVDAVVMMSRGSFGQWKIGPIDELAEEGESFLDIMDVITKLVHREVANAPKVVVPLSLSMEKRDQGDESKIQKKKGGAVTNRRSVHCPLSTYVAHLDWTNDTEDVDVDFRAVLVSQSGYIEDCIGSRNLFCKSSFVQQDVPKLLDEDELPLEKVTRVDLAAVPDHIKLIIFIVSASNDEGQARGLGEVNDLFMVLLDTGAEKSRARLNVDTEGLKESSKIVMMLHRKNVGSPATWEMLQGSEGRLEGDAIEDHRPVLGKLIREFVPHGPQDADLLRLVATTGSAYHLQKPLSKVQVTICWDPALDPPDVGQDPGLLITAVSLDAAGNPMHSTQVKRTGMTCRQVISVSGVRPNSEKDGTCFNLNMPGVDKMEQIVFLVHTMQAGLLLLDRLSCYVNHNTSSSKELVHFQVPDLPPHDKGMLVSRLVRKGTNAWIFQSLGQPLSHDSWQESLADERTRSFLAKSVLAIQEMGEKVSESSTTTPDKEEDEKREAPMPSTKVANLMLSSCAVSAALAKTERSWGRKARTTYGRNQLMADLKMFNANLAAQRASDGDDDYMEGRRSVW